MIYLILIKWMISYISLRTSLEYRFSDRREMGNFNSTPSTDNRWFVYRVNSLCCKVWMLFLSCKKEIHKNMGEGHYEYKYPNLVLNSPSSLYHPLLQANLNIFLWKSMNSYNLSSPQQESWKPAGSPSNDWRFGFHTRLSFNNPWHVCFLPK